MTATSTTPSPRIAVSPRRPSLDTILRVGLSDLPPGTRVTLRATLLDPRGSRWRSSATFVADRDGTVDLHRDAPVNGTYHGADPMGLIWSMEPIDEPDPRAPADLLSPTPLTLVAEVGGKEVASTEVRRLRVPDGVVLTDVHQDGLVAKLCHRAGDSRLPGVVLLGGAEGGLQLNHAALLAAHGYAVLALAYFGLPGLPATPQDIPLEYFGEALRFMQRHPRVTSDRLAVMGGSKGGEAALLVGATFPQVRAVVSVLGSGLVTQGISGDLPTGSFLEIISTPVANWTHQGRPLPYLPNVVTPELEALVTAAKPVPLRLAFHPALERADLVSAATIPVERVAGAVLLVSSGDDQGYGVAFHNAAAERLTAANHPHPWQHVVYPGAGHGIIAPPYAPTTQSLSPGPGVTFHAGGNPAADASARAQAWQATLRFLTDHLTGGQ